MVILPRLNCYRLLKMKVKPDGDDFTTTISYRCSKLTKPASGKGLSMILKKKQSTSGSK